jgi:hypothetical protein
VERGGVVLAGIPRYQLGTRKPHASEAGPGFLVCLCLFTLEGASPVRVISFNLGTSYQQIGKRSDNLSCCLALSGCQVEYMLTGEV